MPITKWFIFPLGCFFWKRLHHGEIEQFLKSRHQAIPFIIDREIRYMGPKHITVPKHNSRRWLGAWVSLLLVPPPWVSPIWTMVILLVESMLPPKTRASIRPWTGPESNPKQANRTLAFKSRDPDPNQGISASRRRFGLTPSRFVSARGSIRTCSWNWRSRNRTLIMTRY